MAPAEISAGTRSWALERPTETAAVAAAEAVYAVAENTVDWWGAAVAVAVADY